MRELRHRARAPARSGARPARRRRRREARRRPTRRQSGAPAPARLDRGWLLKCQIASATGDDLAALAAVEMALAASRARTARVVRRPDRGPHRSARGLYWRGAVLGDLGRHREALQLDRSRVARARRRAALAARRAVPREGHDARRARPPRCRGRRVRRRASNAARARRCCARRSHRPNAHACAARSTCCAAVSNRSIGRIEPPPAPSTSSIVDHLDCERELDRARSARSSRGGSPAHVAGVDR